jgi:hypothetical protein
MKKLFALLVVAGMVSFIACGPSAEEKAKKEQATKDSLAKDSIAKVEQAQKEADSLKLVADATAKADSLKNDSIAKADKKGGKKVKK